jgi:hypothetical protein
VNEGAGRLAQKDSQQLAECRAQLRRLQRNQENLAHRLAHPSRITPE